MFPITEREIRAFVGSKADYYLQRWQLALNGEGKVRGANWAALLWAGFWVPYRKMYLLTVIFYSVILIETILEEVLIVGVLGEPEVPTRLSSLVGFITGVICGAFGNIWYLSHARKVIANVRSQNLPENEHLRVLSECGGTDLFSSVMFVIILFGAAIAIFYLMALVLPGG
jgi:hypothetical protein